MQPGTTKLKFQAAYIYIQKKINFLYFRLNKLYFLV